VANEAVLENGVPHRNGSNRLKVLLVLFIMPLVAYVHRLIINMLIDPIQIDFAISETQASLLQGPPFAIVFGLMSIPMGLLADRRNRVFMLGGGAALWSLGTLFCGFAPSFSILFGAFMAIGLGQAVIVPCVVSLVGDSFAIDRRGLAMGVFFVGVNAGFSLAYAVGGVLLDAAQSGIFDEVAIIGSLAPWRQVFILSALPGFLLPFFIATIREPHRHDAVLTEGVIQPIKSLFSARPLAIIFSILLVHGALLAIADSGIYAWLPRLLSRLYNVSATEFGLTVGAVTAVAGLLAGPIGGGLSDILVKRSGIQGAALVILLTVVAAAIAVPLFAVGSEFLVYCAAGLWVAAIIANSAATFAFITLAVPDNLRGVAAAINMAIYAFVGLGTGPTAIALALRFGSESADRIDVAILVVALPLSITSLVLMIWGWRLSAGLQFRKSVGPT